MNRNLDVRTMKLTRTALSCLSSMMMMGLLTSAAAAQEAEVTIGYGGGYMQFGNFAEAGPQLSRDIRMTPGWVATVHADYWIGSGQVGLRGAALYTDRPLELPFSEEGHAVYGANADLLIRLLPVRPGRSVVPFLSAGGGILAFDLGSGSGTVGSDTNIFYDEDEQVQLVAVGGFGFDIYPGWELLDNELGLRIEGANHYMFSGPFRRADGSDPDPTHNWRVTLGLHSAVIRVF
jgi:hypothetical protein